MRKTCSSCQGDKLPAQFNADSSTADGLRSYCRACQRSSQRAARRRDPDAVRARDRVNQMKYVMRHPQRRRFIAAESRRRAARVAA